MAKMVDIRHWGKNKTPISDESLSLLQEMFTLRLKPFHEVSIDEGRRQMKKLYATCDKPRSFTGKIINMKVPSAGVKDGIPIRIYTPKAPPSDPCIVIYCNGGCQIYGDMDHYVSMHKAISHGCKCILVAFNYRLAPEHRLPAGLQDCVQVAKWVLQNKATVGGSERSPVGVAGDSAGGQSAAHIALFVKNLDFQVLVCPGVDMTMSSPSFDEFHDGPVASKALCEWLIKQLLRKGTNPEDPRWSPIFHTEHSDLPPTLIIVAEVDPMRDDGRRYSKCLENAGVDVRLVEVKGAVHNFFTLPNMFKVACREAYTAVADLLRSVKDKDAEAEDE